MFLCTAIIVFSFVSWSPGVLSQVGRGEVWGDEDREDWVGPHPTIMDTREEDSVYVGRCTVL